jgi:hypothetical protein
MKEEKIDLAEAMGGEEEAMAGAAEEEDTVEAEAGEGVTAAEEDSEAAEKEASNAIGVPYQSRKARK